MADPLRILYVDDDPSLLEIGKLFLEKNRTFTVDTLTSARQALIRVNTERYDAIISDYQMPEMDGIAFLRQLKESGNTTPFIIFTGRGREEVVIEALNEGADFYLQKGGDPRSQFAELAHKIYHAISRKQVMLALKKSEQDYRHLIEHANEAIYVVQDGLLQMVNPQLAELTGYSEQELMHQSITRFIHPEDQAMILDRYERRIRGETVPPRYTFRLYRKDKTIRWVELSAVVITWDERPATLVFQTDITERKLTEDALRESEERYRQFFKTTLDCVFITTSEGQWIDFNDALVEMFGYSSREEMFRIPVPSIYADPGERAVFLKIVERNGYVKERPLRFRKRDGTVFDSLITIVPLKNPDGSLKAFIGTFRDITDRKLTEDALRESEERYRQFFKTTMDSVFMTTPGGQWVDCNDALVEIFGFENREEVFRVPVSSFYAHPDKRSAFLSLVEREGYVKEYPLQFRKRGGTVFDALITLVSLKNPDGSPKAFIGTVRDVTDKKRAAEALRESETRYRHIFESFEDLYYQTDMNGSVTLLSPSLNRLTGWKAEELIGQPATVLYINPEDRATLLEEIVKTGYVRDYELLLQKRDGTQTPASLSASRIYHADGTPAGVAGILRDITRRKRAEEALRESEEKFRSLVEYALDGILIVDFQGRILFANTAVARTIELDSCAGLIGRNVMEFIAEESQQDVRRDFIQVAQGHDAFLVHYQGISAKGKKTSIECIGKAVTYEGKPADFLSIRDITEQKKTQDGLKESEKKYRLLIENSHDIIYTFNQKGIFTFVSQSWTTLLGHSVTRVVGRSFREFVHPDDISQCMVWLHNVIETGKRQECVEYRVQHSDGSWRWHTSKAIPLCNESGTVVGYEGIASDITERKRSQEALSEENNKLTLLSSITRHDINNQMTALLGYLSILEEKQSNLTHNEYFQKVTTAAQRIDAMIQFTREYDEIGIAAPAWQNPCILVDTAATQASLGQILVKNALPAGTEVFADPLIARVFYNFMDNAVRHGGKITTIRFSVQEHRDNSIILCEDDGEGVPAENKERIFERGFGKNTGLGLSLAREILAITGITLRETGEQGKGARFEMTVPKSKWRIAGKGA
ncbi:MAG: PAS domain S-box protein [Methanoregula sp.]|nr:PAS domain S-box protein [Methanoregula sp.]